MQDVGRCSGTNPATWKQLSSGCTALAAPAQPNGSPEPRAAAATAAPGSCPAGAWCAPFEAASRALRPSAPAAGPAPCPAARPHASLPGTPLGCRGLGPAGSSTALPATLTRWPWPRVVRCARRRGTPLDRRQRDQQQRVATGCMPHRPLRISQCTAVHLDSLLPAVACCRRTAQRHWRQRAPYVARAPFPHCSII